MGIVAFVGDVHLANARALGGPAEGGINRRARQTLDVLRQVLARCDELGVSEVFCLGDLFDSVRPEPQLIAAVIALFTKTRVIPHLLVGNHERATHDPGDHALGPLGEAGAALIADRTPLGEAMARGVGGTPGCDVLCVSFRSDASAEEVLAHALESSSWTSSSPQSLRVVAVHYGIRFGGEPPWYAEARDAIDAVALERLCTKHGVSHVFAGHWHWQGQHRQLVQLGALVPNGFRDQGFDYGRIALLDTESGEVRFETMPGPRFVTVDYAGRNEFDSTSLPRETERQLYLSVRASRAERAGAMSYIAAAIAAGRICDGRIEPDKAVASEAARGAARAARAQHSLADAVGAYVDRMELDEGIDREAVRSTVAEYLRGAL